ncbi:MAG TPA: hypothetical protein VGM94_17995 [Galbitalea sp.]|jgi:hypothetical protein
MRTVAPFVCLSLTAAIVALGLTMPEAALASPQPTTQQLVIDQVGTPAAVISADASPVSIITVNADGSPSTVPAVPLPTADSGSTHAFTLSGTSDGQGSLSRSTSGNGIALGGFDESPTAGSGDPKGTTAAAVPRVVAWVGADGAVDTTTVVTGAFSANNIRSVATTDGSSFEIAGNDATTGIFSEAIGGSTPTPITAHDKNFRTTGIAGGQLWASSDATATVGLSSIGTGVPTSALASAVTTTPISTATIGTTSSKGKFTPGTPDGFVFLDRAGTGAPDTAYVIVETLGIYKFGLSAGAWIAEGSIPGDFESITGTVDGADADLYALSHTAASPDQNSLLKITDTGAPLASVVAATPTTVATAPAGTAWRGVALAPTGWAPTGGSGGGPGTPNPTAPTITAAAAGLPLALGDPTNPKLGFTLADTGVGTSGLRVAVTASSDATVAGIPDTTVTVAGETASLAVVPRGVGETSLTLTATDSAGKTGSSTVVVGVSGDPTALDTARYHDGAADGSSVIDVGGSDMLVADDEDSVIRLYSEVSSGAPIASWDFSSHFGAGNELDLEASVRVGNTIYWSGSMSNTKNAVYQASRNVFFATTITGSGDETQLAWAGSYAGLRTELMAWDHANGDALGLSADCSETAPTLPDIVDGCNLEGLETAPGATGTAYLGFRAPVVQGKALIVPVTNYTSLIGSTAGSAHFGDPILLDLGGRSIREIRQGANGQYLITAGAPDDSTVEGLGWALYRWNGEAGSAPVELATLPGESGAAGQEAGSFESIVTVPDSLVEGTRVQLMTDNGTTVFYGNSVAGKDVSPTALQKSVSEWITLGAVPNEPASVSTSSVTAGGTVTVAGSGFTRGEQVSVVLHSTPVNLTTVTADVSGAVSATVTIPNATTAGAHTLILTGLRSGVVATAGITVTAASVSTSSDPILAFTGSDPDVPLTIALLLLVAGLGFVAWRRAARRGFDKLNQQ